MTNNVIECVVIKKWSNSYIFTGDKMNIKSYFNQDGKTFQEAIEMMVLLFYDKKIK